MFGRMNNYELSEFFDDQPAGQAKARVAEAQGLTLLVGTGAVALAPEPDLLVYADMA